MSQRTKALLLAVALALTACGQSSDSADGPSRSSTTATSRLADPSCAAWPELARGEPEAVRTQAPAPGFYVWSAPLGWSVRAVGPAQDFSGVVVSAAVIRSAVAVPPDAGVALQIAGNRVDFQINGTDAPTGLDLSFGCESNMLRYELNGPGGPRPIDQIFVGSQGRAVSNPLVFERQPS